MKIALGVEYLGANYHGWQRQDDLDTVQGRLEEALSSIANEKIEVVCAGRTDAGVNALEQVVHFETNAKRQMSAWTLGVNTHLPDDIKIIWSKEVDDDFHARYKAKSRRYCYVILNRVERSAIFYRHATWHYKKLDVKAMNAAAQCLVGEHDFSAFRASGCQAKTPVRKIKEISVKRQFGDFIMVDVTANAFLHHMVRNIVGSLFKVGEGEEDAAWLQSVLHSRDRKLAGITAPPEGLFLMSVEY